VETTIKPGADTRETTELEEMFEQDIPCGSYDPPLSCPHNNSAILVRADGCRCNPFRCIPCYTQWVERSSGVRLWVCHFCGFTHRTRPTYVPIAKGRL
jgi:Zn-finger protein